ncbi:MAG TPA: BTAD domain-containing putative transcriptional regulator [Candidatus Dormibacteraeota bacterium]|nr:BTAD domain-containing putative transcriptional regulator [Candidatus Dormibacteraeota bacterium]
MHERLISRLGLSHPKFLEICAPAGYGKSTLLASARAANPGVLIDCLRVHDTQDFLRCWHAALNDRAESSLTIYIDHLDALDTDVWPHLRDLFRKTYDRVSFALASRRGLPFELSDVAPPHQIVRIRREDLRLTRADIERLFSAVSLPGDTLERIVEAAAGWPVAALLLLRLAKEDSLREVLDAWGHQAFGDLRSYIRGEVVQGLSAPAKACLDTCAYLPEARLYEIACVAGEAAAGAMGELIEATGLAVSDEGILRLHPMLREAVARPSPQDIRRSHVFEAIVAENAFRKEYLRAAALALESGNPERAAEMLEAHARADKPLNVPEFGALLARLPFEAVMRQPRIWSLRVACLGYVASDLELEMRLRTEWELKVVEPTHARNLQIALGILNVRFGWLSSGDQLLRAAPSNCASCSDWGIGCAVICSSRAVIDARYGRFSEAEGHWKRVALCSSPRGERRARGDRFEIDAYRIFSTARWREDARELIGALRALETEACEATFLAALRSFAWYSWLCDDAAAMEEGLRICEPASYLAQDALPLANDALPLPIPAMGADPRSRTITAIIVAIAAPTQTECLARTERARYLALSIEEPLLRLLPAVILRLADEERGRQALAESLADDGAYYPSALADDARMLAHKQYDERKLTVLGPFVAKCMRTDWYREKHRTFVELLTGTIRYGDRTIKVTERVLDLVASLALHQRPMSRHQLTDALWGDLDEFAAFNALKTCIYRARQQLGGAHCIISERGSCTLGPSVVVDVIEMEAYCQQLSERTTLSEAECNQLEAFSNTLERALSGALSRWDWFSRFEPRLNQLHHRVVVLLAEDARHRNDTPAIVRRAESLLQVDACNERAYELIISALLAAGNRVEAYRELQRYRQAIAGDQGIEPSENLTRLLAEG